MWMHVKALEALLAVNDGKLPVNVRVIVEGEEEVGGEGIAACVREHPRQLAADVALVSDTEMFAPDLPTLCVGLRGMIYTEIEARGARTDLHSGMYGGAAPNPFIALAQIIAQLKDASGHILIPGFYDKVATPSADELKAWKALPFDEEVYRENEVGSTELTGEPGFSVLERTWSRPTLEVHGMPGGFTGAGAKTVIPARALAKVSMRLVPDQTPAEAFALYKSYVESICPAGITLDVRLIHAGDPIVVSTDNPYVRAATSAMHEVFAKDTVFVRGGGSIPIVGDFIRELARRQPPRPQRKVPPRQLPPRHRVHHPLPRQRRQRLISGAAPKTWTTETLVAPSHAPRFAVVRLRLLSHDRFLGARCLRPALPRTSTALLLAQSGCPPRSC
jgi:acetylornithine deacetylase/succinyl-diaminopimelate desuccinylase-like protein